MSRQYLVFHLMAMAIASIGGGHIDVWVGNADNTFWPYAAAELLISIALILLGIEIYCNLQSKNDE